MCIQHFVRACIFVCGRAPQIWLTALPLLYHLLVCYSLGSVLLVSGFRNNS